MPTIEEPCCPLTFDPGRDDYARVGYAAGASKAVSDCLTYLIEEGQALLNEHGYTELPPTSAEADHDVRVPQIRPRGMSNSQSYRVSPTQVYLG